MYQLFSGLAHENVCPNRSSEGKAQRGHTAEPQVCLSGALPPEKGLASLTKGCPLSLELSCRWVACTSVLPSVPDPISLLKFRPSLCLRTPPHSPGQFFLVFTPNLVLLLSPLGTGAQADEKPVAKTHPCPVLERVGFIPDSTFLLTWLLGGSRDGSGWFKCHPHGRAG